MRITDYWLLITNHCFYQGENKMSDVPIQLVVAAFQEEKAADAALRELKKARWAGLIGIKDAAVIRRDAKDKIHIKDIRDVGGGRGSVAGGLFGAAIALLTGGTGLILAGATGALVGGLAAKKIDMGLPNKRLKELGEALKPGTSGIVAIIEHKWVAELEKQLAEAGAAVLTETLKADIAQQLEAGRDVGYTAVASEEGVEAVRMAADEASVEVESITVTEEGIAAKATLMTDEGAITKNIILTEDGMLAGEAMVTAAGVTAEGVAVTEDGVVMGRMMALADEDEAGDEEPSSSEEEQEEKE
jgi:uncharacterized membrane protein